MWHPGDNPLFYVPCYVAELSRVWEKVLAKGCRHVLRRGDTFSLGDNDHNFCYLRKGKTYAFVNEEGRTAEIKFFIDRGCLFKETYSLANYPGYVTYHRCMEDSEIYTFDHHMLFDKEFIYNYPDLIRNTIFSISVKNASQQIFSSLMKQRGLSQKVALYLYGFYLLNNCRKAFTPPFGQTHLAQLFGVSKFAINRIIQLWKQQGVLSNWTKTRLELDNPAMLRPLFEDGRAPGAQGR